MASACSKQPEPGLKEIVQPATGVNERVGMLQAA